MTEPFLGQIQLYGFNFPPKGWAFCTGQIMAIQQNAALFSLLGTNFGGNGTINFGLPNLQTNVAVGMGTSATGTDYIIGEQGGAPTVTVNSAELPLHSHALVSTQDRGDTTSLSNAMLGTGASGQPQTPNVANLYSTNAPTATMSPMSIMPAGGNSPHNNVQPSLTLNYCIALTGIFPQRQ
jgi:microcystin-dependent protein